jgi:hypothetical protein
VPPATIRQRMQALSGMIGRKASVGGFSSLLSNPRAQPGQAVETNKLEYGRGKGNFRYGGAMKYIEIRKDTNDESTLLSRH